MATPSEIKNIKLRYKATRGILLLYVGCPESLFFNEIKAAGCFYEIFTS